MGIWCHRPGTLSNAWFRPYSSIMFSSCSSIPWAVDVCDLVFSANTYSALSSISNGIIHPGLSRGCDLGLERLTVIAGSPCADAPGWAAILVCVILSCWYCCKPSSNRSCVSRMLVPSPPMIPQDALATGRIRRWVVGR